MDMTQRADPAPSGETQQPAVDAATGVHLRALLKDTLDLAAILDRDGSLRYLNGGGRRLLVLSPGARATDLTVADLVIESERSIIDDEIRPALRTAGWWSGTVLVRPSPGTDVPAPPTPRSHP